MSAQIEIEFSKSFPSARSLADTFAYCADLEKAVKANFPGLLHFEKTGEETYRWTFESVKYSGYEFQIKFTTRFEKLPNSKILIHPTPAKGESSLTGRWELQSVGTKSEVRFHAQLKLELPIPFFLKSVAQPITQKEISKIFDRYIQNVGKVLSA